MSVVVKDRICRQCGRSFPGGPRAWYCPECRYVRRLESAARFRAKGNKADRPLGSLDKCVVCGKEYIVNSSRQKYCHDCAYEAVREVDKPESRRWNSEHKETYYPAKNAKRKVQRYCIICGAPITSKTCTVTCDNPDCKLERKRQRQRAADAKRGGYAPPPNYTPTKRSGNKRMEGTMTDKQINIYFGETANYTDPDAFVSDVAISLLDPEDTGKEVDMELVGQLRILWHVAMDPFKDLLLRMCMSQSQCSVRFCVPLRTVQDWYSGRRTPPPYIRLMMAEAAGILKLR